MTIGEILKDKGIVNIKGKLRIVHIEEDTKENNTPKCLAMMNLFFKRLDQQAREQYQKAIIGGSDPDYILKSTKDLGDREPTFEWKNGMLTFVPNRQGRHSGNKEVPAISVYRRF